MYINFLKKLLSYNKDEDTPIIEEVYKNSLSTLTQINKPKESKETTEEEKGGGRGGQQQQQQQQDNAKDSEKPNSSSEKGKDKEKTGGNSGDNKRSPSEKDCKTIDTLFSGIKGYKYGLELESLTVRDIESGAAVEKYEGNSSKLILFEEYFLLVQLRVNSYKLISKIHIGEAVVEDDEDGVGDSVKIRSTSCCDLEYVLRFSDTDKKDLIYSILKK